MALDQDVASEGADLNTYHVEQSESDLYKVGLVRVGDPGWPLPFRPEVLCTICGKEFHAPKAVTRHIDDVHSPLTGCPYPDCTFQGVGTRKHKKHRQKAHNEPSPPRRRAR